MKTKEIDDLIVREQKIWIAKLNVFAAEIARLEEVIRSMSSSRASDNKHE